MTAGKHRKALAGEILGLLDRCRASRERITTGGSLSPPHRRLAAWQSARLAWTHRDFFASPRYRPAVTYFLSDLYGDRDYSPRDEGMERVYPVMIRTMPVRAMRSIALGLEMHALTQELDVALCRELYRDREPDAPFEAADYAAAYRGCDNAPERRQQIELIRHIGQDLDHVVHKPLVYGVMRLSRRPARLAGLSELHDFIERGFEAFRHMNGADEFLETICRREHAVMTAILDGAPTDTWAHPEAVPETTS